MQKYLLRAAVGVFVLWFAYAFVWRGENQTPERPVAAGAAGESPDEAGVAPGPDPGVAVRGGAAPREGKSRVSGVDARPREWVQFERWMERWDNAAEGEKAGLEEEGGRLAERRGSVFYNLMETDPQRAFALALPLRKYVALPDSVRAKVETPFNLKGFFDAMREMSVDEKGTCVPGSPRKGEQSTQNGRVLLRAGSDPEAETYGFGDRLLAYPSKEETTLHGYWFKGRQVLGENSLQRLAPEDIEAAVWLFGESAFGRSVSPVSGDPANPALAAIYHGTVHWFAHEAELLKAESLLRAIDASVNPKPITRYFDVMGVAGLSRGSTTELITPETYEPLVAYSFSSYGRAWTCTKKKVFVAPIRYSQDGWDTSKHIPVLQAITAGVDRFIRDISRGKSEFEIVMPSTAIVLDKALYPNESEALLEKLKDYYQNTMGGTPADIDIWTSFVETTNGSAGFAGRGLAGSWKCWITDCTGQGLWCHEYGHCYGLPHANSWLLNNGVSDPLSTQGTHKEYGDQLDVMGNGTYPQGYWRVQALWTLGWRDTSEYPEVSEPGVYNVYRYDYPDMGLAENTAGTPLNQGLRIRRAGVSNQLFSVAHRASYSYLPSIGKGLQLVWVKENQSSGWYDTTQSHMLDLTPQTRDNNKDGGLPIGKTFYDAVGGVSITPLALRGTAPNVYVETEVLFGPFSGNRAPASLSLTVPSTADARSVVSMLASATDQDGDSLAYHWNFGDGTVGNTAAAAQSKSYAVGGTYTVNVTVSDKKGGTTSATASISVSDPVRSLATQTLPGWMGGYLKRVKALDEANLYALGSYGQVYKSTDGSSWTKVTIASTTGYTFQDAARSAGTLVLLATKDSDQSVTLFFSQDEGATWSSFVPSGAATLRRLIWTGNRFIATAGTAANNYVLVSDTGVTWTKVGVPTPAAGKWNAVASDGAGNVMLLGTQTGVPIVFTGYSSDDGLTWTTFATDLNASGEDLAYFQGNFYAGGWNLNVSKVTGRGRVFTALGTVAETYGGDFFLSANASFALARESRTDTATNLQISRNGTDWFSVNLTGNPYFSGASYFRGHVFLIRRDIDAQGYSSFKLVRTAEPVATSFAGGDSVEPPSNGAPAITSQPVSRSVVSGGSTTFSVTAIGNAPLAYQWRKNGENLSDGTLAAYGIASVQASDAGTYSVVVSNSVGSVTSSNATLMVTEPPTPVTITQQPVAVTVAVGGSFSLSVQAAGSSPLTYQWRKDGTPVVGATASTYFVSSAQTTHAGSYSVVVTNAAGSVSSDAVGVSVLSPPVITQQPVGGAYALGGTLALRVTVSGTPPFAYQWYKNNSSIAGATSGTYAVSGLQTVHGGTYKVVVSNQVGSTASSSVAVSILEPPVITLQPLSVSVAVGGSVSLRVQVTGSPTLGYQWRKDGVAISGATASIYSIPSAQSTHAGVYTVVVTNSVASVTSAPATLSLIGPPVITQQPVGGSFVQGGNLSLSVVASGTPPFTYQWFKNNAAILGATTGTYSLSGLQAIHAGTYKVTVSNAGGSLTSTSVTVAVLVPPAIATQPQALTVAAGAPASFTVSATGTAPLAYQWRKDGVNIPGASAATYSLSASQPTHGGSYSVVVSNAAGSVTSANAVLTVQSPVVITVQPVGGTVNAGSLLSLSVAATGTGPLTYQWFRDGVQINGATAATYSVASAGAADWGSYTVRVSNVRGAVTSSAASVLISSAPILTQQPSSLQIVGGQSGVLSAKLLNAVAGTYQWKRNGVAIGAAQTLPAASGVQSLSLTLPAANDLTEGAYVVVLTNARGATTSSTANVSVLFNTPKILAYRLTSSMTSEASLRATDTAPAFLVKTAYNNESLQMRVGSAGVTSYAWAYQAIGAKSPVSISGQTTVTLNFASSSVPKGKGVTYILTVKNTTGSTTCKVTIGSFLTPSAGSMSVVAQPLPATVTIGKSASLSAQVSGKPVSYTWYKVAKTGDIDVVPAPSGPALNVKADTADSGGDFFLVATDSLGSSVTSNTVNVTVLPAGE